MTRSDDSTPDMANRITSAAADRLLSAVPPGPDAEGSEVARLLAALRAPMMPDGVREQEAVATFAAAVNTAPARLADRRTSMRARRTAKIAAATAALVLLGSTAAAAATGSLPDGAQSVVSKALSHVSVDVPDPETPPASATDHPAAVGPDAAGAAHRGLCTAWAARGKTDADRGASGDSTAFSNLRRAAHDDGKLVKEFCADVLDGSTTSHDPSAPGADHGQSGTEHGQSGTEHGQSGTDHGNAGDPPAPVDTPNGGGVGTATDASKGADDTGAGHASDAATRGSGNADAPDNPDGATSTTNGASHSGR